MRTVTRSAKPPSLRRNAVKWKRELVATLKSKQPDPSRVDRLLNRYRRNDVRTALDAMYEGLCCYCEAHIGVVAFEHIEHRWPKAVFPTHTFEWDNLHLACPKCNQAKGDKWNRQAPILDSTATKPKSRIEKHLTYKFSEALACARSAISLRGQTTIDHADLNRQQLRNARARVAHGVLNVIAIINAAPKSPKLSELRLELGEKIDGPFGSMVKWLLDNFLTAA